MGSFSQVLDCSSGEESEQDFYENQTKRLSQVEIELMQSTLWLLPKQPNASTITELAGLTRLVQEGNRMQLLKLQQRLGLASSSADTANESPLPTFTSFARAGPLESVQEGDVETEGATTPGSMFSPFSFAGGRRKSSISPATPSMDGISFRYVFIVSMYFFYL